MVSGCRASWRVGARGTLVELTRASGRAHVVRAVLEGVAHRGADLVEAAEADGGAPCMTRRPSCSSKGRT